MVTEFTAGEGLRVRRSERKVPAAPARAQLIEALDRRQGMLLECAATFPGRYRPQWRGFVDPAVQLFVRGERFHAEAPLAEGLAPLAHLARALRLPCAGARVEGELAPLGGFFGLLRRFLAAFRSEADPEFALYAALGYDLALARHGVERQQPREAWQSDAVLFLPHRLILCRDPAGGEASELVYDFGKPPAATVASVPVAEEARLVPAEPAPGAYRALVERARAACRAGTFFEVVAGQSFRRAVTKPPSRLYRELSGGNPSPYGMLAHLGPEHLVATSPEMFVRVGGGRVESAPISGTVRRGRDAGEDAERILELLDSEKAAAELTMCTDVDRNDKAAICLPGSVQVLGRRQIETYSHVIHTVDHVAGTLRPGLDAVDAVEAHLWSVTLVGAPRAPAMAFIEANESAPRRWYGGALGRFGFDGTLDSGIVLRAIQMAGGIAEVRVGASLLHASDPADEERETLIKGAAMLAALAAEPTPAAAPVEARPAIPVALLDLGSPFPDLMQGLLAAAGGVVERSGDLSALSAGAAPVVLLCGIGAAELATAEQAAALLEAGRPIIAIGHAMLALGRALGAQIVPRREPAQGTRLGLAATGQSPFATLLGLARRVGCYHLACLDPASLPDGLSVAALAAEGDEILAVEARNGQALGLLFHPQSLLTDDAQALVEGLLRLVAPQH